MKAKAAAVDKAFSSSKRSYYYLSNCNNLTCSIRLEYKEDFKQNAGFSRSQRSTLRDGRSGPVQQSLWHFFHPFLTGEVEAQHTSSSTVQRSSLNFSPIPKLRKVNTEILFNWWKRYLSVFGLRWKLLVHRTEVTCSNCPGYVSQ